GSRLGSRFSVLVGPGWSEGMSQKRRKAQATGYQSESWRQGGAGARRPGGLTAAPASCTRSPSDRPSRAPLTEREGTAAMAQTYDPSDLRKGLKIMIDGSPYVVIEAQFVKPGKGAAFTRTRMKNLLTGGVIERNIRSGEKMDGADVEDRDVTFLYKE